jgi:hypothetical protein
VKQLACMIEGFSDNFQEDDKMQLTWSTATPLLNWKVANSLLFDKKSGGKVAE